MATIHRRSLLLLTVLLGACSTPVTSAPTLVTSTSTTSSTTTVISPTTTGTPPTTTGSGQETGPGPSGVAITLPTETSGAPGIVLVHGGGWLGGAPSAMGALATSLADRGAIVFNASYRTGLGGGGYPATFDDVACAMRFARQQSDQLGGSGDISLVGHSAGAHIATVVALSNDAFGSDCQWGGSSTPDSLIGLAGLYELEVVAPLMEIFLGGTEADQPAAWEAADPIRHLENAAGISITLIHGSADTIIPAAASDSFALALEDTNSSVSLVIVDQATHNDMIDPVFTAALILP